MIAPYDDGYESCACFWGTAPGSFVRLLVEAVGSMAGLRVLDAGCGEGKNAAFLARMGASVDAIDVSHLAIENGRRLWGESNGIAWRVADIREVALSSDQYDVVIAYGLLHCLPDREPVLNLISKFQAATRPRGLHVVCTFNDRHQELGAAHPGFQPCLLRHDEYVQAYSQWRVLAASDADLTEQHPHNMIKHTHSLTRLLARRVAS